MATIPHAVVAAGWIPFVVVLFLILCFSFFYIRYFQSKYDSELHSTIVSILGLALALLTVALVPIDIFIVSYMKDSDGSFKDWAKNKTDRETLTSTVMYAYYALYVCEMIFLFFLLPFSYFFYEEGDEDTTTKSRLCSASKFTLVFLLVATVLLIVGAFVPLKNLPHQNGTDWDYFKNIISDLQSTNLEDSVSFSMSSLTTVGMLLLIIYTGYGLSAWPMDLIKGRRSTVSEQADIEERRTILEPQVNAIKSKYLTGRRTMSAQDRQRLEELNEEIELMARREAHLLAARQCWWRRCCVVMRPVEIVFGVLLFLGTLLIFLSLLLTSIDKLLHSLGPRMGYALPVRKLPNPIDITLVFAQQVFPVDYVLLTGVVLFLFFASMGGIQHIGIWFCCLRMYKMRPGHTRPQALLMLVFCLILIVLAMNVLLYQLTPQYTTYGSQRYVNSRHVHNATHNAMHRVLLACSAQAPVDECVMTRMSLLLVRFFYKVWVFGALYYWCNWALLGIMLIGFIVAVIRKRRSAVEGAVDRDDFDSDEDIITA